MSVLWDVIVAMGVVGYPSDLKSVFCACNAKLFPQTSVSSDWHTMCYVYVVTSMVRGLIKSHCLKYSYSLIKDESYVAQPEMGMSKGGWQT